MRKSVKKIAVTGGAGQIAYHLLFRIANGELLGSTQPIALQILELPPSLQALEGVKLELEDCAFPLLQSIHITTDPYKAFEEADFVFLIGATPRGPGMERKDLLECNGKIFVEQGQALNAVASLDAKIFVIGNPCNTNCLIAIHQAPRLSPTNFFAMTRLDQNRATFFLAQKAQVGVEQITHLTIWGNHSSTQVPDFFHAKIGDKELIQVITEQEWLKKDFISLLQKRGAAIIEARGKSSAASAVQAIIDSVHDQLIPKKNSWFSAGIFSSGNPYHIDPQLVFSFPCYLEKDKVQIIPNLTINKFLATQLKITEKELMEERDLVRSYLRLLA